MRHSIDVQGGGDWQPQERKANQIEKWFNQLMNCNILWMCEFIGTVEHGFN